MYRLFARAPPTPAPEPAFEREFTGPATADAEPDSAPPPPPPPPPVPPPPVPGEIAESLAGVLVCPHIDAAAAAAVRAELRHVRSEPQWAEVRRQYERRCGVDLVSALSHRTRRTDADSFVGVLRSQGIRMGGAQPGEAPEQRVHRRRPAAEPSDPLADLKGRAAAMQLTATERDGHVVLRRRGDVRAVVPADSVTPERLRRVLMRRARMRDSAAAAADELRRRCADADRAFAAEERKLRQAVAAAKAAIDARAQRLLDEAASAHQSQREVLVALEAEAAATAGRLGNDVECGRHALLFQEEEGSSWRAIARALATETVRFPDLQPLKDGLAAISFDTGGLLAAAESMTISAARGCGWDGDGADPCSRWCDVTTAHSLEISPDGLAVAHRAGDGELRAYCSGSVTGAHYVEMEVEGGAAAVGVACGGTEARTPLDTASLGVRPGDRVGVLAAAGSGSLCLRVFRLGSDSVPTATQLTKTSLASGTQDVRFFADLGRCGALRLLPGAKPPAALPAPAESTAAGSVQLSQSAGSSPILPPAAEPVP